MSSVADICNQALGTIGVADEIQDLDTETSKEATACRRFYAPVRDQVLRDFPWPRLRARVALALVATDPNEQWGFSYRMPSKVAALRRIIVADSSRVETWGTRYPYELGRDDTGELIYTDAETALAMYTYGETNTERLTPDVIDTMVLLLASKIAPRFGPEAVKLGDRALKLYEWRRATAQANALNEEHPDPPSDAEMVTVRDE